MSRLKAVLLAVVFVAVPLAAIAVPPWEPGYSPEEIDERAAQARDNEAAYKREIENAPVRQVIATEKLRKEIAGLRDEMRLIRELLERLLDR
jgi:hypothetical protein